MGDHSQMFAALRKFVVANESATVVMTDREVLDAREALDTLICLHGAFEPKGIIARGLRSYKERLDGWAYGRGLI